MQRRKLKWSCRCWLWKNYRTFKQVKAEVLSVKRYKYFSSTSRWLQGSCNQSSGQPGADATVKIVVLVLLMQIRSIICRWCSFYWELKFDKLLRYRINNGIKRCFCDLYYGSRGANGVILITTKTGKGLHISKLKLSYIM
jgi:hypothetical protein